MSPKARFLLNHDSVKKHADLVAMREFQEFLDVALLHYQYQVTASKDSDGLQKIRGAQEFTEVFQSLSRTPTTQQSHDQDNLLRLD